MFTKRFISILAAVTAAIMIGLAGLVAANNLPTMANSSQAHGTEIAGWVWTGGNSIVSHPGM